jgi:hypothetical protein
MDRPEKKEEERVETILGAESAIRQGIAAVQHITFRE